MKAESNPIELLTFLEKQNKDLRQDLKLMTELLKINRQALSIGLKDLKGSDEKNYSNIVQMLFHQNQKLSQRNFKLRQEIQQNMCQTLISEQIVTASNEHQKFLTSELKQKLKGMRKQLEQKQRRIIELMKNIYKDSQSDRQYQLIEYTDFNKISVKLFNQIQSTRDQNLEKNQEIQKLKEQRQELLKLNLVLTKQINELRTYSLQSTKSQHQKVENSHDLSKFLKYQQKIGQHNSGESQSNSDDSNFSFSDNNEQSDQMSTPFSNEKSEISNSQNKQKPSKIMLPKLQLKKAKEIQNIIVKKINNDEKKKSGVVKQQKVRKIQQQCQQLRKKLGLQLIMKHNFERQNNFLKKFICELQNRNEILVRQKENKTLEKNIEDKRKINNQKNMETLIDVCRDVTFNQNLKDILRGKKIQKRNVQSFDI